VYPEDIKNIPIPIIPVKLQEKIVSKCEKIDEEYNNTRMSVDDYVAKLEQVFVLEDIIIK